MYRLLLMLIIVSLTQLSCSDEQYARLLMEVDKANTRLYELQRHQTSRFSPDHTTKAYEELALAKQMARLSQLDKAQVHLNQFYQSSQLAIQDSQFQTVGDSSVVLTAVDQTDFMTLSVNEPPASSHQVSMSPPVTVLETVKVKVTVPEPVVHVAKASKKPTFIIVKSGDWLMKIARQLTDYSVNWSDIFLANRDVIRNPNRIYPGQKLIIP